MERWPGSHPLRNNEGATSREAPTMLHDPDLTDEEADGFMAALAEVRALDRTSELEAENERLRRALYDTRMLHAYDDDHPCEACREELAADGRDGELSAPEKRG